MGETEILQNALWAGILSYVARVCAKDKSLTAFLKPAAFQSSSRPIDEARPRETTMNITH
jgi:hypothetical protein